MLHGRGVVQRLLHMFGGCTELWTNISAEAVSDIDHRLWPDFGAKPHGHGVERERQCRRQHRDFLVIEVEPGRNRLRERRIAGKGGVRRRR